MFRRRHSFLLIKIMVGLCLLYAIKTFIETTIFGDTPVSLLQYRRTGRGVIDTMGCTIPDLDPLDPSIRSYVEYPYDIPKCPNPTMALLGSNRTTIWIRSETFQFYKISDSDELTCCYRSFYRPESTEGFDPKHIDDRVQYNDCVKLDDAVHVQHEFVKVSCAVNGKSVYTQFYLFAQMKQLAKRNKKREKVNRASYNILIVGLDTVSRMNLLRTMPKTASYLKMLGAIDMMGYNKVGENTFPNLVPMLMGVRDTDVAKLCRPNGNETFDDCPFIWKRYERLGYYTAYAEDCPMAALFNCYQPGFSVAPTDYYPRTMFIEAEATFGRCYMQCINDVYHYKFLLNYMEDVIWRLKSKRLFGLFWENSNSHDHLNWPMKMDRDYLNTFVHLQTTGYFEDTIVFFVSDHGIRWGPIRLTKQGHLEERLPFLYILIPKSFQESHKLAYNNLKQNSKRLVTPFDVYETLLDLTDLHNVDDDVIEERCNESYALRRGISLFLAVPGNRTCKAADIDDQWCTCREEDTIPADHPKAVEAADILVRMFNTELKDYSQCAKLVVAAVLNATEIQVGIIDDNYNPWREFMVVVRTAPGDAVYEATLRNHVVKMSWQLAGAPGRLNRYEKQDWCMDIYKLKPYCYCLQNNTILSL